MADIFRLKMIFHCQNNTTYGSNEISSVFLIYRWHSLLKHWSKIIECLSETRLVDEFEAQLYPDQTKMA